jgi:hypothetical protein
VEALGIERTKSMCEHIGPIELFESIQATKDYLKKSLQQLKEAYEWEESYLYGDTYDPKKVWVRVTNDYEGLTVCFYPIFEGEIDDPAYGEDQMVGQVRGRFYKYDVEKAIRKLLPAEVANHSLNWD